MHLSNVQQPHSVLDELQKLHSKFSEIRNIFIIGNIGEFQLTKPTWANCN